MCIKKGVFWTLHTKKSKKCFNVLKWLAEYLNIFCGNHFLYILFILINKGYGHVELITLHAFFEVNFEQSV